eukprot:6540004-Prymnesium_polylepis.1
MAGPMMRRVADSCGFFEKPIFAQKSRCLRGQKHTQTRSRHSRVSHACHVRVPRPSSYELVAR